MVDRENRAAYFRRRYAERRAEGIRLLGGKCAACGGTENLEFDHKNPSRKTMEMPGMANASRERFLAELMLCQLLCRGCHRGKSAAEGSFSQKGAANPRAKLSIDQVSEIREIAADGTSFSSIGRRFGIARQTVSQIVRRKSWTSGAEMVAGRTQVGHPGS